MNLFGQGAVLASLSARQARERGLLMSGTFGRRGFIFYVLSNLRSCLESKLQTNLAVFGSTLFSMTWKHSYTPAQRPLLGHQVWVRRTFGGERISALPTPTARDFRGRIGMESLQRRKSHPRGVSLPEFMQREVGRPGYLNPDLVRLLMGYPEEWEKYAPTATPSSRKSRRSS